MSTTHEEVSPIVPHAPNALHLLRVELLEAIMFALAVLLSTTAAIAATPRLFCLAGPCIVLSALLRWVGLQLRLSGVLGRTLRNVAGPAPVFALRMRVTLWLIVGLGITAWGFVALDPPARHSIAECIHATPRHMNAR